MRKNSHVSIISRVNYMKFNRQKEKHRSDYEFSRKLSILSNDVIFFFRKFKKSTQRKSRYCKRNHKPVFSDS